MARITVAYVRDLLSQLDSGITFSRMVELLNEKAAEPDGWLAWHVSCDLCGHNWIAVRVAGLEKLECPNCRNIAGFTTPEDNV